MTDPAPTRDDRITGTALDLLRTRGPRAVTVERVAAESGVAKTTIYRRYRDRTDMLTAALSSLADPPSPPADADLPAVLRWVIEQSHRAVGDGIGTGGVAALLTGDDPAFTESIRDLLVRHRAALTDVIDLAVQRGIMRAGVDSETLIDVVAGSYVVEFARRGTVSPDWVDRTLDLLLDAVAPTG